MATYQVSQRVVVSTTTPEGNLEVTVAKGAWTPANDSDALVADILLDNGFAVVSTDKKSAPAAATDEEGN